MKHLVFEYGWVASDCRTTKTIYITRKLFVIKEAIKQFVADFSFTRKYRYKFFIKSCKISNI